MRNLARLLCLLILLAPALAGAQQYQNVPDHTVIGRIGTGSGSGPSQAVPWSVLQSQLSGSQNANTFYAGPTSGSAALPTFRQLTANDLPSGASTLSTWFCNTAGYILANVAGVWVCDSHIPVNAKWLGAKGDGSTDDSTALNNAAATAAAIKAKLYIPAGNYVQSTAGISVSAGIEIYGDHPAGIGGLCAFNTDCSTNITSVSGGTNLLPGPGINSITATTNDSVYIHDLEIAYTSLPTTGSGVYGIKIAGTGPAFGVNAHSHIWNVDVVQADIGVIFSNAVSFGFDHNLLFNFRTSGVDVTGASTYSTTGNTASSTTLTITGGTSGIYVGSYVRDTTHSSDLSASTTVTAVNGTSVTITPTATGTHTGDTLVFSTNIAGGGDDAIGPDDVFLPGAATGNTCYGTRLLASTATSIFGNKYNAIPSLTTCSAIYFNPNIDGTSYEPTRIFGNSIEGAWAGIVYYNNCTTPSTCSSSQTTITGNQIWTGAGFGGGPNIYMTGASTVAWVNEATIVGNVLNVVGGGSNNFNIILGAGFAQNILVGDNVFGNTGGGGSTSIFAGGNTNVRTRSNHALTSDSQSLGTGTTAPGTLACGTLLTNTLANADLVVLFGGTGVTAVAHNGTTIYSQASAALPLMSIVVDQGDTIQVTCSAVPTNNWASFNP